MDTTSRTDRSDSGPDDGARGPDGARPGADVHVIGGGLGGLAAAAVVARAGLRVVVHERRGRFGGRATTDDRRGYRFNQGPHAFYVGAEGAAVLARLGITPRGIAPDASVARMVRGGESFVAPGGVSTLLRTRLLGVREKASLAAILARLPRIDRSAHATHTVDDWLDGLTGHARVREVLHSIVRLTTYVNAPELLSADVAIRQLQLGLGEGVLYLDRGWQQLVDVLAAQPGVQVHSGAPITSLDQLDQLDQLDGEGAGDHAADGGAAVIVATGSPRSAAAITGHPYEQGLEATVGALDLGLAAPPEQSFVIGIDEPIYLSDHGIPADMVPVGRASVSLAEYHRAVTTQHAPGPTDTETAAADTAAAETPAGESAAAETAAADTADGESAAGAGRARLTAFAAHAGISPDDIVEQRYLHRMVTVSSIPTAADGGLRGRPGVAVPDRPGVFVAGDWVGAHGHLADAVLSSAEEAAVAAIAHVRRRSAVR